MRLKRPREDSSLLLPHPSTLTDSRSSLRDAPPRLAGSGMITTLPLGPGDEMDEGGEAEEEKGNDDGDDDDDDEMNAFLQDCGVSLDDSAFTAVQMQHHWDCF